MSIQISTETEARLTAEARRLGISVDALLERVITERAALTHAVPDCQSGVLEGSALFIGEASTTMSGEPGIVDTNVRSVRWTPTLRSTRPRKPSLKRRGQSAARPQGAYRRRRLGRDFRVAWFS